MINIPHWDVIDCSELQAQLNIPTIKLVNDFVGVGYGVIAL